MLTLAPTAEPWTGCALHPSPVPRVLLELALASLFHDGPRSYPRSPPRGCHPPLMPGPAMRPAPGGSRSFCYDKSQNRVVGDVEETGGVVEAWLPCAPAPWPPPWGTGCRASQRPDRAGPLGPHEDHIDQPVRVTSGSLPGMLSIAQHNPGLHGNYAMRQERGRAAHGGSWPAIECGRDGS